MPIGAVLVKSSSTIESHRELQNTPLGSHPGNHGSSSLERDTGRQGQEPSGVVGDPETQMFLTQGLYKVIGEGGPDSAYVECNTN